MSDAYKRHGALKVMPGATEVRIAREFPHGVDKVWQALVESDRLAEWLAPGEIESHEGGAAKLSFPDSGIVIDSIVSEFDAPHAVAYSWSGQNEPNRPLRFETLCIGDGTRVSLTLQLPTGEDAARIAAGFEAHLEMLDAALNGAPIPFPFAIFKAMREAYRAA